MGTGGKSSSQPGWNRLDRAGGIEGQFGGGESVANPLARGEKIGSLIGF